MTKDIAKTPEHLRAEWLRQENEWCNKQPWRPLNAHVEAVSDVIRSRKIGADCLQVLESVSASGSGVSELALAWNKLVEKKDGLEVLSSLCRTTLSDLIADSFDKDFVCSQNIERDATWASVCPDGDTRKAKVQLLQNAAELMAYTRGFGGGLVGA